MLKTNIQSRLDFHKMVLAINEAEISVKTTFGNPASTLLASLSS